MQRELVSMQRVFYYLCLIEPLVMMRLLLSRVLCIIAVKTSFIVECVNGIDRFSCIWHDH